MRKYIWLLLPTLFLFMSCFAQAADSPEEIESDLLSNFDFYDVEEYLEEVLPNQKQGFFEMLKNFISGETKFSLENIWHMISEQILFELNNTKSNIAILLAIVLIAALFHNFSGVFRESKSSEVGFFVLYLLLITISLNAFQILMESVVEGLYGLTGFLQLLGPIYFFAVALATGSATSVSFYTMILLLISIVELVIVNVLIPIVQVYLMIRVLNNLSQEQYLSKLANFLHTVIVWSLRTMLGAVIGINFIQGMLNPAIDSVKRSVLTRGGEAIPIIGNLVGGTAEVVLGTAKLIQNGIGAVGAVICIMLCLTPVLKMVIVTLMYKLTAALVQPISDKRIVNCISSIADGTTILLRVLTTSALLFLITIAMVANSTT